MLKNWVFSGKSDIINSYLNRAIGMTKGNVQTVALYEAIANLSSAMLIGFVVGLIAACMTSALLMTFAEMPFKLNVNLMSN